MGRLSFDRVRQPQLLLLFLLFALLSSLLLHDRPAKALAAAAATATTTTTTTTTSSPPQDDDDDDGRRRYVLVGVSGGLQDGFPDHGKMDYRSEGEVVEAIYVGRALVRGTKSFLDVMEPGWRQYAPRRNSSAQPLINSVVVVSGCREHANQYWIYAVDSRQFVTILSNEPRFLGITPDTAMVDLVSDQTDDAVQRLAQHEIQRQNKTDASRVAVPIVVAVWYHESFVPSPAVRTLEDGTAVTNFPESLARWAGVDDADRTAAGRCTTTTAASSTTTGAAEDDDDDESSCPATTEEEATIMAAANQRYWDGIRRAIRRAEDHRPPQSEWRSRGPPFRCERPARLGVGPETARINYPLAPGELASIFRSEDGYHIDFDRAEIRKI